MTRPLIPLPELVADLDHLGHTASVVHNALIELLDGWWVPDATLLNCTLPGALGRRWQPTWRPAIDWWRWSDGVRLRRTAGLWSTWFTITRKRISSVSFGGRGGSINIPVACKGGARATVGIPGSGISYSEQAPAGRSRAGVSTTYRREAAAGAAGLDRLPIAAPVAPIP